MNALHDSVFAPMSLRCVVVIWKSPGVELPPPAQPGEKKGSWDGFCFRSLCWDKVLLERLPDKKIPSSKFGEGMTACPNFTSRPRQHQDDFTLPLTTMLLCMTSLWKARTKPRRDS